MVEVEPTTMNLLANAEVEKNLLFEDYDQVSEF